MSRPSQLSIILAGAALLGGGILIGLEQKAAGLAIMISGNIIVTGINAIVVQRAARRTAMGIMSARKEMRNYRALQSRKEYQLGESVQQAIARVKTVESMIDRFDVTLGKRLGERESTNRAPMRHLEPAERRRRLRHMDKYVLRSQGLSS